jgi:hypothetical protein
MDSTLPHGMELRTVLALKASLCKLFVALSDVNTQTDRELNDVLSDWFARSESFVALL